MNAVAMALELARLKAKMSSMERAQPQGTMTTSLYGQSVIRPVQVGFPAELTDAYDTTVGYAWKRLFLDTLVPEITDPDIAVEGEYAFDVSGNELLGAGQRGWMEPAPDGAPGWVFTPRPVTCGDYWTFTRSPTISLLDPNGSESFWSRTVSGTSLGLTVIPQTVTRLPAGRGVMVDAGVTINLQRVVQSPTSAADDYALASAHLVAVTAAGASPQVVAFGPGFAARLDGPSKSYDPATGRGWTSGQVVLKRWLRANRTYDYVAWAVFGNSSLTPWAVAVDWMGYGGTWVVWTTAGGCTPDVPPFDLGGPKSTEKNPTEAGVAEGASTDGAVGAATAVATGTAGGVAGSEATGDFE